MSENDNGNIVQVTSANKNSTKKHDLCIDCLKTKGFWTVSTLLGTTVIIITGIVFGFDYIPPNWGIILAFAGFWGFVLGIAFVFGYGSYDCLITYCDRKNENYRNVYYLFGFLVCSVILITFTLLGAKYIPGGYEHYVNTWSDEILLEDGTVVVQECYNTLSDSNPEECVDTDERYVLKDYCKMRPQYEACGQ